MKRFLIIILATVVAGAVTAQTARELIMEDSSYALGVYRLYPTQFKEQTAVP